MQIQRGFFKYSWPKATITNPALLEFARSIKVEDVVADQIDHEVDSLNLPKKVMKKLNAAELGELLESEVLGTDEFEKYGGVWLTDYGYDSIVGSLISLTPEHFNAFDSTFYLGDRAVIGVSGQRIEGTIVFISWDCDEISVDADGKTWTVPMDNVLELHGEDILGNPKDVEFI